MDFKSSEFLRLVEDGMSFEAASKITFGRGKRYCDVSGLADAARKLYAERKQREVEQGLHKMKAMLITGETFTAALLACFDSTATFYRIPEETRASILGRSHSLRGHGRPADEIVSMNIVGCRAGMLHEVRNHCKEKGLTINKFVLSLIRKELNRFRDEQAKAA